MSLFKKSNRKFRQRSIRDDSEEENNNEEDNQPKNDLDTIKPELIDLETNSSNKISSIEPKNEVKAPHHELELPDKRTTINGQNKKNKNERTAIKLTFDLDNDDEVECEEFQVKQSSYSIRLTKQIEREKRRKEKEELKRSKSKISSIASGVSIRKLMESRKQEINVEIREQLAPPQDRQTTAGDKDVIEMDLMDIADDDEEENLATNEPDCVVIEDDLDDDSNRSSNEDSNINSNGPKFVFKSLRKGAIPDSRTIDELKKQRKLARDADDLSYIPLSQRKTMSFGRVESEPDQLKNVMLDADQRKSRLIREDPNDIENCAGDDVDADEERVDFCIDKAAVEKEKFREAFYLAQEEDESERLLGSDDSDCGLEPFEREQIRKGVLSQPRQSDVPLISSAGPVEPGLLKPKKTKTTIPRYLINAKTPPSTQKLIESCDEQMIKLQSNLESARTQLNNIDITIDSLKESIDRKQDLLSCVD